ncbi:MAG TPA: TetR/AcrR family transcriptional regulator [Kribbella sp.]|uniref:TetR/AcrR family transcriptional regulator n=1 Tax=Kribbella sp. TaxID=1871183 RepID=UPI002D76B7C6|nr:TetR/AcrR family transcriptional regulator [Kribbella sp.]HET6292012.1 TetR/AcrR family transcriptional regulator [Kribbella sp.]
MSPVKPLRADARRNRDQLVAVARAVFDELGTAAPLDEVARRAGIGNATLYRHFPTRDDLLIAVYAEEVAGLSDLGEALLGGSADPLDALFEWLEAFVGHVAAKGDLARTLEPGARRSELHEQWHAAMFEVVVRLVDKCRAAGSIQPDLDPIDLLVLVSGTATAEPVRVRRLLRLIRRGVSVG